MKHMLEGKVLFSTLNIIQKNNDEVKRLHTMVSFSQQIVKFIKD